MSRSDSYERPLLDTEEGDASDEAIGSDDHTLKSTSKQIFVINNGPNDPSSQTHTNQSSIQSSSFPSAHPAALQRTDSMRSVLAGMGKALASKLAAGSIKGSIFTMCISTVGAGSLALPYAIRNVGLIFGIALVMLSAPLAYFTLDLLLISAEYLPETLRGPKPLRDISYQTYAYMYIYSCA